MPRIAVLSPMDQVQGFLDNDVPDAIHFYEDTFHLYLTGAAYTFNFKVMTEDDPGSILEVGARLAFRWNNQDFYLNVLRVDENEWEKSIEADGLSFELLNETVDKYEAASALSFEEYVQQMGAEMRIAPVTVNEISDQRRKLTLQRQTILKRLYTLANEFEAELSFHAVLNKNYSLQYIGMEIRKKIGTDRTDEVLRFGKEITSVSKKRMQPTSSRRSSRSEKMD